MSFIGSLRVRWHRIATLAFLTIVGALAASACAIPDYTFIDEDSAALCSNGCTGTDCSVCPDGSGGAVSGTAGGPSAGGTDGGTDDGGCMGDDDCPMGICLEGSCRAPSCADRQKSELEADVDCGGPCVPCDDGRTCVVGPDCASKSCVDGTCVAPTCEDGVTNGNEGDVDCGGDCDASCGAGKACTLNADCTSGVCSEGGTCAEAACTDGVFNGTETDRDCGGDCAPCGAGDDCTSGDDCASRLCGDDGKCAEASCNDDVKNGSESDEDCGGGCDGCTVGDDCRVGADCASGSCSELGLCAAPSCDDGVKNGDETFTDCGGSCSLEGKRCDTGAPCTVPNDCTANSCLDDVCQPASCGDKVKNPAETDVDCGGVCPGCPQNGVCIDGDDCESGSCPSGTCAAPTCSDGVQNGDETGPDCGGGCVASAGKRCGTNDGCTGDDDCESDVCDGVKCLAPTCGDGKTNGTETGPDCGGSCVSIGQRCANSVGCSIADDCVSQVCNGVMCLAPTCSDGKKNGMETDVDCGSVCPTKCDAGEACGGPADCDSNVCEGNECVAGACAGVPAWFAGTTEATVLNVGKKFTCKIPSWCSDASPSGLPAWEPGVGTNWEDAWNQVAVCD